MTERVVLGLLIIFSLAAAIMALARRNRRPLSAREPSTSAAALAPDIASTRQQERRALAFDAVGEAILVTAADGRLLDCNAAASVLFDLEGGVGGERFATTVRSLETRGDEAHHHVLAHGSWRGQAWVRQPDGSVRLCLARIVPLSAPTESGGLFVEAYRDVAADQLLSAELRDLLFGVRGSAAGSSIAEGDASSAAAGELQSLGAAFRDLERVIVQYERLLPVLSASDPLTESIAGLALETRDTATAIGVPELLAGIPRRLSRLRAGLERLERGEP